MRSRALSIGKVEPRFRGLRRPSTAALVFLRGRDADGGLRELAAARTAARPVLGALAAALVQGRAHEALGYRSLGDYGRERLGMGARTLREWARVWRRLEELPLLRRAVLTGDVSWSVARRVVALVTPETQEACLETVRGRTVRAVEAIVAAVRQAESDAVPVGSGEHGDHGDDRVLVRVPCAPREAVLWTAAVELARRAAGEALSLWECADRIAAEAASAMGAEAHGAAPQSPPGREGSTRAGPPRQRAPDTDEHGLREAAFPDLAWKARTEAVPAEIAALVDGLEACSAREIDRRLCAALAFFQRIDFETGRILRQMTDRKLFAELGFESLARYAEERLDLAPRTARRLVALARAEHRAPAVATAFRSGKVHTLQAEAVLRVADLASARKWVARAQRVTLRRLEDDVGAEAQAFAAIAFRAPPAVASFFLATLERAGSIERLLAHAIVTWIEDGRQFKDYADFERDGFRCTVPGCTARRNLQSHHIRYLSAGGPDLAWNRTTLCAHHHLRGVHAGVVGVRGRAPDDLVFVLGPGGERFRSGDVRVLSVDAPRQRFGAAP